jgi:hypothetical protein
MPCSFRDTLSVVAMSIGNSHSSGIQGQKSVLKTAIQDVAGEVAGGTAWTARHGGSWNEHGAGVSRKDSCPLVDSFQCMKIPVDG